MPTKDEFQLSNLPIFSGLPKVSKRFLQDHLREVEHPAGTVILQSGARTDTMAIVASGKVELRTRSGVVKTIGEGGTFGEAMMRYAVPSTFTVKTISPTKLYILGRSEWLAANYLSWETPEEATRSVDPEKQAEKSRFQFPWKGFVSVLVLAMIVIVTGPALLGWTDGAFVRLSLQAKQPELAEEYLKLAISWRPQAAALQDSLGYVYTLQGKPDLAVGQFRHAVELNPDLASAQNNLGVALLLQGQPGEALAHLQTAVDLDPGNAPLFVNLGDAYLAEGDSLEAMPAYEQAFSLDPTQAAAQARWAFLALKQGQLDEARQAWQNAATSDPSMKLARQGLGVIAFLKGQPAAALPELEAARELDPKDVSTHYYLGLVLQALGRPMDAGVEFLQILSSSQDPATIRLAKANLQQVYDKLMPGGEFQKGGPSIPTP